jgi:predicted amidophosphoribosyltransferase
MENLRAAFRVRQSTRVQDRRFIFINDVTPTGTVGGCARVLRQAGGAFGRVLTLARA